jgi:cytoskeletal protein CcmA (bactofilin family)
VCSSDLGGSVEAKKATAEDRVSVGGSITTSDGVYGRYVEIGRRGKVNGPIYADEVLIGERAEVNDIHAKSIEMENGAEARNLYGEKIQLESHCQIFGEVKYTQELETENNIKFAKPPEKVDKLP